MLPFCICKWLNPETTSVGVGLEVHSYCAWKCPGPFGYELLSADETGGPKTVDQPFFVTDATELRCRSHVTGFWINFEALNDVVLITGPLIPVLHG